MMLDFPAAIDVLVLLVGKTTTCAQLLDRALCRMMWRAGAGHLPTGARIHLIKRFYLVSRRQIACAEKLRRLHVPVVPPTEKWYIAPQKDFLHGNTNVHGSNVKRAIR
ncbi:MAG: hypothetical protein ACRYGK_08380 [Janthinobacterium lividum]